MVHCNVCLIKINRATGDVCERLIVIDGQVFDGKTHPFMLCHKCRRKGTDEKIKEKQCQTNAQVVEKTIIYL